MSQSNELYDLASLNGSKLDKIRKIAKENIINLPPETYGTLLDRVRILVEAINVNYSHEKNDKAFLAACLTLLGANGITVSLYDSTGEKAKPIRLAANEYVDLPKHIVFDAAREVRKHLNIAKNMSGPSRSLRKKVQVPFPIELIKRLRDPESRQEIFDVLEKEGYGIVY